MQKVGKKRLAIALTLALVLGAIQIAVPQSGKIAKAADILVDNTGDGTNYSVAEDKLTISTKGTYKLSSAQKIVQVIVEAGASGSTLDLNGQTIEGKDTLSECINVSAGSSLTILATNGGVIGGNPQYRGIYIGDGGSVTMKGGTLSTNEKAGVLLGMNATFTLTDGTITGCKYGVANAGTNGKFIMEGGSVTGNKCGVEVSNSSNVELKGGSMKANTVKGVHLRSGNCSLSGTIDLSEQTGTAPDISFDEVAIAGLKIKSHDTLKLAENISKLVHSNPTKTGYEFSLHEGSKTGTDVTEKYKTASYGDKDLFVVWKEPATPTPTPTPTAAPTATAAPTGSPSASPSALPTGTPGATPASSATPSPGSSASPYPTLRPEINENLRVTYPDASDETIQNIITYANENRIPENVLIFPDIIFDYDNEADPKGASFGKLRLRIDKRGSDFLHLRWTKQPDADGYILVGNHCNAKGKKYKLKEIIQPAKTSCKYTAKKVDAGKILKGTYYKFLIYAYKDFDGQKVPIAASVCVHGTTLGNKKNTVAKAVNVYMDKGGKKKQVNSRIVIKAGKKIKLSYKEVPDEKGKTIRPHRPVLFESEDDSIFTAGKKTGVIRAVKKGTATLYAYAQNGIYKSIKVVVK